MNKTKFVTVRLPQDLYDKLKAEAEKNTRTVSAQLMHYIRLELDKK
jgi:predicted DNA-binding protein